MRAQRRLKGERSGGRGRKPGKSSIAVKDEAKLCLEAAKKMLDVEVLEVGSTFSISNLSERQVGPRGCIVYVMRVLRGFKMLSQIKSEETGDTQYKWKGHNMDDLKEQIRKIFEKDETSEDVVWNITRDMIKTFASSRKGSRVYLPLINAQYYGAVDESRRLNIVSAILEGIDIVRSFDDELGGFRYIGPKILQEKDQEYFQSHQKEYNLKNLTVALPIIEIREEHKYEISPPSFASDAIQIGNVENIEQRRSITNKDVMCRCGFKSNKTGAHTGFKKRMRCKTCARCTAPKCGKCRPCNVPSMKKPCENRVCLFPIIPKCPCFQ